MRRKRRKRTKGRRKMKTRWSMRWRRRCGVRSIDNIYIKSIMIKTVKQYLVFFYNICF